MRYITPLNLRKRSYGTHRSAARRATLKDPTVLTLMVCWNWNSWCTPFLLSVLMASAMPAQLTTVFTGSPKEDSARSSAADTSSSLVTYSHTFNDNISIEDKDQHTKAIAWTYVGGAEVARDAELPSDVDAVAGRQVAQDHARPVLHEASGRRPPQPRGSTSDDSNAGSESHWNGGFLSTTSFRV